MKQIVAKMSAKYEPLLDRSNEEGLESVPESRFLQTKLERKLTQCRNLNIILLFCFVLLAAINVWLIMASQGSGETKTTSLHSEHRHLRGKKIVTKH